MKPLAVILATLLAMCLATFAKAQISPITPPIPTLRCDQFTTTVSNICYKNIDILTPATPGTVWCENEPTTCQVLNATNQCERINCNKYWNTQAGWWRLGSLDGNCWNTCPNTGTGDLDTSWCSVIELNEVSILSVLRRLGLDTTGYTTSSNNGTNLNHRYPSLRTTITPFIAFYRNAPSSCSPTGASQANNQNICCCADSTDPLVIAERCPTSEYVPIIPY